MQDLGCPCGLPSLPPWDEFSRQVGGLEHAVCCEAIAFSDSEVLARELAGLALAGHKRAPRRCGVVLRGSGQTPAATGDLRVVTAWNDTTLCVMRSTNEQVTPFDRVPAAWAEAEGEGDG